MQQAQTRMRPFLSAQPNFTMGSDTPRQFLERCLEDLAHREPEVGAFTVVNIECARQAADLSTLRWKAGRPLSGIDGMPVAIKDIIDTDDLPTEHGSDLYAGHRPLFGAASATALRLAGAVILGKTVTTEFASTEPRGTRNPWDLNRTPGGSSSGSAAAVAAGMVAGAMGTQVVGSIIRPAGFCGVYGYKPTLGGINRGGSLDMLSQSCSGVLAASLADSWVMTREIVARVGGDPGYVGVTGPMTPPPASKPKRLALLQTAGWSILEPSAREALDRAIATLVQSGVEVVTRSSWPDLEAVEETAAEMLPITMRINAWEWRWPLNAFMARNAAALSSSARERADIGMAMTQDDYATAITRRSEIRKLYAKLEAGCDGIISVTAPGAAPIGLGSTGNPIFVVPGSILGVPVVTLPLLQSEKLPLGLQIVGFEGQDAALFAIAAAVEAILTPV
ncbi:amidase [Acidisoma cellulosilytica]|uniref:Amidase n=1 Tax=Acidisoma cellulosilyticum TaxID=2802395 RepID=A0A964E5G1_9PROT|nr:amidase [Acidisoma cellulosilyticum]MCB8882630.1 amidase [Acidisoma cellulosilyticum]